jgi:hypothetical protein
MGGRAFTFLVLRAPVGRRKKPQDINLPTTLQRSLHLHKDPTLLSSDMRAASHPPTTGIPGFPQPGR